ncbi:MAG: hypothetical protein IKO35_04130, partial [Elusimicrobiaceae bacterium]|nr:hypothetical protein [Elusimicrobiaceae bacterium]
MGIVENVGKGITSFLQDLQKQKSTAASYRSLAQQQEYQAAYAAAAVQQQNSYLLQSAAEKARLAYQNYLQNQGSQRANWGASGLRSDSATVQYMLKNNRFQALLEERQIRDDLQQSVYTTDQEAGQQIRSLRQTALENRQ